ncbi:MAG: helix-turn-helix transcriptional regulator [Lachnospiraceae bacterium]|nr:helix-turn-helix transcriptional regulator [Lachnospiraceae bacterium]
MKIHDKIFNRIKELGMTQKEFSEKTGIPQSTISDWKGKDLNPAADKIMIICGVLEMTPNELLSETVDEGKYNAPDKLIVERGSYEYSIIEDIRQLNEEQRQRLMAYMKGLNDL